MNEWLTWITSLHPADIELGLDRVREVAAKLQLLSPGCPVITVAGTNGKGSTVAGLESIYRTAGFRVGAFTSPFLFKHNEQVRVDGELASDEEFCIAFEKIEAVRGHISLTTFEFFTLAALLIFKQHKLDVLILEVGLGGRLDAVNIIDADVAVITSIALDHTEWLGPTLEDIAREKAGILRENKFVVCGEIDPPAALLEIAQKLETKFFCQDVDFHFRESMMGWNWTYQHIRYDDLPLTTLAIQNMSTVLMVVTLMQNRLPVSTKAIHKGLVDAKLMGRIQIVNGPIMEIFDVSHNPASVSFLANRLKKIPCHGKTHAVFSMLADKDIVESINAIKGTIDTWYVAPLSAKRAAAYERLSNAFYQADIRAVTLFSDIVEAYEVAKLKSELGDRIVVFGSFHTVADVWNAK